MSSHRPKEEGKKTLLPGRTNFASTVSVDYAASKMNQVSSSSSRHSLASFKVDFILSLDRPISNENRAGVVAVSSFFSVFASDFVEEPGFHEGGDKVLPPPELALPVVHRRQHRLVGVDRFLKK